MTAPSAFAVPTSTAANCRATACAEITFAVPYYSGLTYLEAALRSVLRQTTPNWKLLVCDDGSESGADALVASYRDGRVRYVKNERNLGMVGNWNRCLDLAGGGLVTLLHADDELLPDYVETMLAAAKRHPSAAAIFCPATIINAEGKRRISFPDWFKQRLVPQGDEVVLAGEPALRALLRGNFIMCPTLCYRMEVLGARRFCSRWRFVQDLDLTTRLLLEGEALIGLPSAAYAYRRHVGSATTSYTQSLLRFHEESALYDELARATHARGWHRAEKMARRKLILGLNLTYCAATDLAQLRLRQGGEKIAFLSRLLFRRNKGGNRP